MSRCQVRGPSHQIRLLSYYRTVVNCWPSPSNDGTCEVNIEYELENENVTLHDVLISIPLPYVPDLQFPA